MVHSSASPARAQAPAEISSWRDLAGCRGRPLELFFDRKRWREALGCCRACPVAEPCLLAALVFEEEETIGRFGVFGGTTPAQRAEIARYLAERRLRPKDFLAAEERWWRTRLREDARCRRSS